MLRQSLWASVLTGATCVFASCSSGGPIEARDNHADATDAGVTANPLSSGQAADALAESANARARLQALRERFWHLPATDHLNAVAAPKAKNGIALQPSLATPMHLEPRPVLGAGGARFVREGSRVRVDTAQPKNVGAITAPGEYTTIHVPLTAGDPVRVEDGSSGFALEFTGRELDPKAPLEVADGIGMYVGAAPGGGDVAHRVTQAGLEDYLTFERAPSREQVTYKVSLEHVAGLRLVSNTLEFLDASGTPRLRVSPPRIVDATGKSHEATLALSGCNADTNPAAPWDRPVTAPGATECVVSVDWSAARIAYPAILDPAWGPTGKMVVARFRHAATRLGNGNVLVSGGIDDIANELSACDLYNPAGAGTFAATGAMKSTRYYHQTLLVAPTKVVAVSGELSGGDLTTSEIYNSATGTWAFTGAPDLYKAQWNYQGNGVAPVLLSNSKVLILGQYYDNGAAGNPPQPACTVNAQCPSASCNTSASTCFPTYYYLQVAQVFDATLNAGAGGWQTAPPPNTLPYFGYGSLAPLPNGRALLSGGQYYDTSTSSYKTISTAEIYDNVTGPGTDKWTATTNAMVSKRQSHLSASLGGAAGKVVLVGGNNGLGSTTISEVFDPGSNPVAGTFTRVGDMAFSPTNFTPSNFALHGSGKLVIVNYSTQSIVYDPVTTLWSQIYHQYGNGSPPDFSQWFSYNPTLTTLASGKILGCSTAVTATTYPSSSNVGMIGARLFDFVANGGTCQSDSECQSGHCPNSYTPGGTNDPFYSIYFYDGVCCDKSCDTLCVSCRNSVTSKPDGTCANIPAGTYDTLGGQECKSSAGSSCGQNGMCDGNGGCQKYGNTQTCSQTSCATSTSFYAASTCDGSGNCVQPAATACTAGYTCSGTVGGNCLTSCYADSDCTSSYFCDFTSFPYQCKPDLANGKTCSSASQCTSGNCVYEGNNYYCCDKACSGTCQTCALKSKTGVGVDGTCTSFAAGSDPDNECTADSTSTCGKNGSCDGNATTPACQLYSASTVCAAQSCATSTSQNNTDLCNGTGSCVDKGVTSCVTGYACTTVSGVTGCQTSCSSDAQCVPSYYCDTTTNTCKPDKAQGQGCTASGQCPNDNCVDNVCCDTSCTGTCRACSAAKKGDGTGDGTCGTIAGGKDPDNECTVDPGYPASCKSDGMCDGSGSCRTYAVAGVTAKPPTCTVGTQTNYTCDGAGNLTPNPVDCLGYLCNGTTCGTSCTSGAQCNANSYCLNGVCVQQKKKADRCTTDAECPSTGAFPAPYCREGVCCDDACGSNCQACSQLGKGACQPPKCQTSSADGGTDAGADDAGADGGCTPTCPDSSYTLINGLCCPPEDGHCANVLRGTDQRDRCPADPDVTSGVGCGNDGTCDGNGNCAVVANGTSCGNSKCLGSTILGQICNGTGQCIDNSAGFACSPYLCRTDSTTNRGSCTNPCKDDTDCADGYYCDPTQACVKKLGTGSPCTSASLCGSGFCSDGLCCDSGCRGQCEACDVPGHEGSCTAVTGTPHGIDSGARTACANATDPDCGGACDGVNSAVCSYAPTTKSCGTASCANAKAQASSCDGQGACVAKAAQNCVPFACDESTTPSTQCLTTCTLNTDCATGYVCSSSNCVPDTGAATCSDDLTQSVGPHGMDVCLPFKCNVSTGVCKVACASSEECADGYVCEPTAKTCVQGSAPASTAQDNACSCRVVGGGESSRSKAPASAGLGLLLGLGLMWRRRRGHNRAQ